MPEGWLMATRPHWNRAQSGRYKLLSEATRRSMNMRLSRVGSRGVESGRYTLVGRRQSAIGRLGYATCLRDVASN
jgi:hypothetical protein